MNLFCVEYIQIIKSVNVAVKEAGVNLESLSSLNERHTLKLADTITDDPTHVFKSVNTILLSGRRYQIPQCENSLYIMYGISNNIRL